MVPWKPLLAAACVAAVAAAMLSILPAEYPGKGGDRMAFHAEGIRKLGSDNLADLFAGLPLHGRLRYVDWRNAVLTVDVEVPRERPTAASAAEDLNALITLAFRKTGNAERLLVRFVDGDRTSSGNRQLLLAADIRKDDPWLLELPGVPENRSALEGELWRGRLRLSVTRAGQEAFDLETAS